MSDARVLAVWPRFAEMRAKRGEVPPCALDQHDWRGVTQEASFPLVILVVCNVCGLTAYEALEEAEIHGSR